MGADAAANSGLQSLVGANLPAAGTILANATNWGTVTQQATGAYNAGFNGTENLDNSDAYWLGLGFKLDLFDPIVFKLDAVYGAVDNNDFESYNFV